MFNKILVAIDASDYSSEALPTAIELARRFGSELHIIHVVEHDRGRAAAFTIETPADATRLVAEAVKQAKAVGLVARGELVDRAAGHVADTIVASAVAGPVDLIVMGSRGLSDAQGFLLGSVTHRVMQLVGIPVLVAREPQQMRREHSTASSPA
jgi:nucleotide-binding universal stress UspA family protein